MQLPKTTVLISGAVIALSIASVAVSWAYYIGYMKTDVPTFLTMMQQHYLGNSCIGVQTATDSGARLTSIQPGSPAAHSSFQVGDRVVVVNGLKVRTSDDLAERVRDSRPGDVIGVEVRRSGFLGIRDTLTWGVQLGYYRGDACLPFPR